MLVRFVCYSDFCMTCTKRWARLGWVDGDLCMNAAAVIACACIVFGLVLNFASVTGEATGLASLDMVTVTGLQLLQHLQ